MPAFWLIVMEACVWLIDYWMYETHGWRLMLHSDWAPAAYLALILVPPLIWPRLAHDAPHLP